MAIRFSFDLGTNSLGFAIWRTGKDPKGIFGPDAPLELLWSGARVFKDGRNPQDKQSLAVMRRVPKAARTRRDRFVKRRQLLLDELVSAGLMPHDRQARKLLEAIDPYQIRALSLDGPVSLHHLGRAFFHINQRRGFQSNRKADRKKGADQESGKIARASAELARCLSEAGARTYGEWLWARHKGENGNPTQPRAPGRLPTRIRMEGEGAKALYEFYPTRAMLRHEFDAIWEAQKVHHPNVLTDDLQKKLRDHIIFFQRPLKPPVIGRCLFEPEKRAPKALPSIQAREIFERLAHVRLSRIGDAERPLTLEERNLVASVLLYEEKLSFTKFRKILKLDHSFRINFEEVGEVELLGSRTMKRLGLKTHLGQRWKEMCFPEKDALIQKLLDAENEDGLVSELICLYDLSPEQAQECAGVPLADGYSRLGPTANAAILRALIEESEKGFVIPYSEAVKRAGERLGRPWHHSDERDGEIMPLLPYYGRVLLRHILPGSMDDADRDDEPRFWGRIANPTVHIGLNQLRRVTNAMIRLTRERGWNQSGLPDQVVVELARELKLSAKQKEKEARENKRNREANEQRRKKLAEIGVEIGVGEEGLDNGENRKRMRLFEEQQKAGNGVALCPYSLKPIPLAKVFSDDIEVDHILPRSRTLDLSSANEILCYRSTNRTKRGKTPYEAFSTSPDWSAIEANARGLPPNKRWRFRSDAMEQFEANGSFLDRQLNETKYLSRISKAYLGKICDPDQIYVTPGRLTALLRGKWGLNSILSDANRKERTDHRHHAVDAIAIGAMTRGLIQHLAGEAGRLEATEFDRALDKIPVPFEGFRDAVREKVNAIVISNKPEHGKGGALHEDSSFGFIADPKVAAEIGNLVRRKPLVSLTPNEVDRIRDPLLRNLLQMSVSRFRNAKGKLIDKKGYLEALSCFAAERKIRRVRVGKAEASIISVTNHATRSVYKALSPGENYLIDIVQFKDGSWKSFPATYFDVNQKGWRPIWEKEKLGGKLVMCLHKSDPVALDARDGTREIKTVIRIGANVIYLIPHFETGKLQERHDMPDEVDPFRWDFASVSSLKARNCSAIKIDELGRAAPVRRNV